MRYPNVAVLAGLIVTVMLAGHVTVPEVRSMLKSSRVNPPSTAGWSGRGLMTGAICFFREVVAEFA